MTENKMTKKEITMILIVPLFVVLPMILIVNPFLGYGEYYDCLGEKAISFCEERDFRYSSYDENRYFCENKLGDIKGFAFKVGEHDLC